jgi:hypothetical protein
MCLWEVTANSMAGGTEGAVMLSQPTSIWPLTLQKATRLLGHCPGYADAGPAKGYWNPPLLVTACPRPHHKPYKRGKGGLTHLM